MKRTRKQQRAIFSKRIALIQAPSHSTLARRYKQNPMVDPFHIIVNKKRVGELTITKPVRRVSHIDDVEVSARYRNKGYASKAIKLASRYPKKVKRVYIRTAVNNIPMQHVISNAQFKRIGKDSKYIQYSIKRVQ